MGYANRPFSVLFFFFLLSWGWAEITDLEVMKMSSWPCLGCTYSIHSYCLHESLSAQNSGHWDPLSEFTNQIRKPLNNSMSSTDINTWTLCLNVNSCIIAAPWSASESPACHYSCTPSPWNFQDTFNASLNILHFIFFPPFPLLPHRFDSSLPNLSPQIQNSLLDSYK